MTKAARSTEPPNYERGPAEATSFTPFEKRVQLLAAEFREKPATVLAERVNWAGVAVVVP